MGLAALIGTAIAIAAALIRLTLGVKLMNEFRVEEYTTDPRARRMYIIAFVDGAYASNGEASRVLREGAMAMIRAK